MSRTDTPSTDTRQRVALVGVGHRGLSMWGLELLADYAPWVDLVALCDSNPARIARGRELLGQPDLPAYATQAALLAAHPDLDRVLLCVPDHLHDAFIVEALEAGVDVVTEKPMATTAAQCASILAAQQRTGRRVDVTFNYRYTPTSARIKQILLAGEIGRIESVDFSWHLDTRHGADYFRRWHAQQSHSGSLWVHKASHHFDLLNWWLDDLPETVYARSALRHYGANRPAPAARCKDCPQRCEFFLDLAQDPWLHGLFEAPSAHDGYVRDACVFRPEIDIADTMNALIQYRGGAQVNYSLSACLPVEGFVIALNGSHGRIEVRQHERQPWATPPADELRVMPLGGGLRTEWLAHGARGHFGGDAGLQDRLFKPAVLVGPDVLGQRAGAEAGAAAALCGLAALHSARTGQPQTFDATDVLGRVADMTVDDAVLMPG